MKKIEIRESIPLEQIKKVSNIRNENEEIDDLKASIEQHGLLQPIVVSKSGSGYKLIAGHRRYLACSLLGWETIPAVVQSFKNPKIIQLTENIQRKNLNRIEESAVVWDMKNKLQCPVGALAVHLGKDYYWVKKRIAFHEVREYLIASETLPVKSIRTLTFDIAVKMYSHPKKMWLQMAASALGKRWYPEELEELFKSEADPGYKPKSRKKSEVKSSGYKSKLEEEIGESDYGEFSIIKDNSQCIIKLMFADIPPYRKMLEVLQNCGGEVL